jgi:hypothetical protein
MKRITTALMVVGLTVVAGAASAQTTGTAAMSATIPSILYISVTGAYAFPTDAPTWEAGFEAGMIAASGNASISHRANVPYKVTIEASGAALALTGAATADAAYAKATTDFLIRPVAGSGTYVGLGAQGAAAELLTRSRGALVTTTTEAKLNVNIANDVPGTYSTTVTFTIASNY